MAPQEVTAKAPPVILGFSEPISDRSAFLQEQPFPSKIGGKPIWFPNVMRPLRSLDVMCDCCGRVMVLLMQMYAPEEDTPEQAHAYHRSVYVFICKQGACLRSLSSPKDTRKCIRVFRSQASLEGVQPAREAAPKLCAVCGLLGDKTCSQCRAVHYCSVEHQKLDWTTAGNHKQACKAGAVVNATTVTSLTAACFPESEIISQEDDYEEELLLETGQQSMALLPAKLSDPSPEKDTETSPEADPQPWEPEKYESTGEQADKAFLHFQKRMRFQPEQCLRYARLTREERTEFGQVEPLWVNEEQQCKEPVAACPHCQAPRTFEFQIMPQMLLHLDLNHADPNALDFGTIVIYSCTESCNLGAEMFAEEIAWLQEFSPVDALKQSKRLK